MSKYNQRSGSFGRRGKGTAISRAFVSTLALAATTLAVPTVAGDEDGLPDLDALMAMAEKRASDERNLKAAEEKRKRKAAKRR